MKVSIWPGLAPEDFLRLCDRWDQNESASLELPIDTTAELLRTFNIAKGAYERQFARVVIEAIAEHPLTPQSVLKEILHFSDQAARETVCMRMDLSDEVRAQCTKLSLVHVSSLIRRRSVAHTDREVLFANEAFVVGMLQAVSGGAVVAAIAQAEALATWAGRTSFLLFISSASLALGLAVLAAYWRHQYKMWDVKAQASASQGKNEEAVARSCRSSFFLWGMRYAVVAALLAILFALTQLIVSLWLYAPR
jgi:hypothetical protein